MIIWPEQLKECRIGLSSFVTKERLINTLYFVLSSIAYFQITQKKMFVPVWLNNLFAFSLFLYGASLIISIAPTGHRFLYLANSVMLSCLALFSTLNGSTMLKKTTLLLSPFILLLIVVELRLGMGFVGPMTIIGNFLLASAIEINTPLISYIKDLI